MTPDRIRAARRAWFHRGHWPANQPPVAKPILDSWQRCLQWGLDPFVQRLEQHILPTNMLARRLEQRAQLVQTALPHMHYLHQLIRGSGSVVLLTDAQGVVLQALGDADFLSKANSVLLKPGASWTEQHRGTNAIGTALATGQKTQVCGSEHYFDPHGFLTCSAAPIRNAQGRIVAVLDISTDYRMHHAHTLGLVRSTVDYIEKQQLLAQRTAQQWILTLHAQPQGLGTLAEGVLLLDEDGTILAANAHATAMLGLHSHHWQPGTVDRSNPLRLGIHRLLDLRWETLLQQHAAPPSGSPGHIAALQVRSFAGVSWWIKLDGTAKPKRHLCTSTSQKLSEIAHSSMVTALAENQGNIRKTAQSLGISRTTLYRHLKKEENGQALKPAT